MDIRLIFSGADSVGKTIAIVLAILAAVTMCVLLFRTERKLVSRSVGTMLLLLRMIVLLVLLAVLLKPLLTSRREEDQSARVLVAVDVSESMSTADRHASPAEKLRWAQALGMLGNSQTDELIDSWIEAYESGQEPNWAGTAAGGSGALAENRKKHIEAVLEEIGRMPRHEFVRRLLHSKPRNLLERLGQDQIVDLRAFTLENQVLTSESLQTTLAGVADKLPSGGTDAVGLLAGAIGEDCPGQLRGVVLLTDGRQTEPGDPEAEASRLSGLGVPVFTVPVGSVYPPRDVSVASLDVPQSVFANDSAQVRATLLASGMSGQELQVVLQKDGQTIDQVTMTVADDRVDVQFDVPTDEVGKWEYTVATEVLTGELRDDNNRRDFVVSVVDNKAKVLLVDGDARWEFRYLKNALDRDNQVELTTVLFRQPFAELLNDTFLPRSLPDAATLAEQLAETDILIIGDVAPSQVSEADWLAIEKAVADEGLTVLAIPGRRHLPDDFNSVTLRKLLPVSSSRQLLAERVQATVPDAPQSVFRLQPTAAADELAMFQMGSTEEGVKVGVPSLPGHPWAFVAEPSPAATVWANVFVDGGPQLSSGSAAMIHHYYGFGQVVWMGVDSTWRWRRRAGDTYHHRFWGQLIRWAARNKAAAGNDQVRMSLSDVIADETESIEVNVRWNPRLVDQLNSAVIKAVAVPVGRGGAADAQAGLQENTTTPDSPQLATTESDAASTDAAATEIVLQPVDGAPERFVGRLPRLKAGDYEVMLQVEDDTLRLDQKISTDVLIRRQLSTELADISCNRDLLKSLAEISRGRVFEPWELDELPDALKPDDVQEDVVRETTLWDHWSVLLIFFCLLMSEWVIRKLNGLP